MRVEPTANPELIKATCLHPSVWYPSSDDGADREHFSPQTGEGIVWLAFYEGEEFLGIIAYVRQNKVLWDCHVRLLPNAYGRRAAQAAQLSMAWMWENTGAWRLQAYIPSSNPKAIQYGLRAGMTICGCNPASWAKDGELYDLVLMGISRPGGE